MRSARCLRLPVALNSGALLGAQDLGQRAARLLIGDMTDLPVLLEHLAVEEAQGTDDLVEVRPGDPAIAGQVELVPADVLRGEPIGGRMKWRTKWRT